MQKVGADKKPASANTAAKPLALLARVTAHASPISYLHTALARLGATVRERRNCLAALLHAGSRRDKQCKTHAHFAVFYFGALRPLPIFGAACLPDRSGRRACSTEQRPSKHTSFDSEPWRRRRWRSTSARCRP